MRYPHFEIDIDGMYTTVLCGRGEVLKHFMAFISFYCIVVIVLLFNCCRTKNGLRVFKEGHKIGCILTLWPSKCLTVHDKTTSRPSGTVTFRKD